LERGDRARRTSRHRGVNVVNKQLGSESLISLLDASVCGLGLRTESARRNGGASAHPLRWYKALTTRRNESLHTTSDELVRRYFFGCDIVKPGYMAGLNNVQSKPMQPSQPSHSLTGFFDDIDTIPAQAGFFHVPSTHNIKTHNPALGRAFLRTNR
jgi:hypothetical protein